MKPNLLTQWPVGKWVRRISNGIIAYYGVIVCLMLLLHVLGRPSQLVAQINVTLTLFLLPALILFPLCALRKHWRLAALTALPCLVFVLTYGGLFLPRSVVIPQGAVPLRLLTYNLHAERNILEPMVNIVREAQADIVAFQEMSWQAADAFDTQLADLYPYRAFYREPNDNPYHGRGLLSRYPIVEEQSVPAEYPIPVRLQWAVVRIHDLPITVYNFHAPPSYPVFGQGFDLQPRSQQIGDLVEQAARTKGAVLLMGDFNTNDLDANYPRLVTRFKDVYWAVGWGMGFTGPDWSHSQSQEGLPFIPIHQRMDYIFHNDYFTPLEARVWPTSGGSDHRPLYAVLALKP